MIITLYKYINKLNGKNYIGMTCHPIIRFRDHAKGQSGVRLFNAAVKKYGIQSFEKNILAIFDDTEAAAYHEQAAILAFGSLAPKGYNLTSGAPFTVYGGPLSESRCKEMTKINRKTWADPQIRDRRLRGLRAACTTPEYRQKFSDLNRGNKSKSGQKYSEETRKKLSIATKAYWDKAKLSKIDPRFGRQHSAETRSKMSEARKSYLASNRKEKINEN